MSTTDAPETTRPDLSHLPKGVRLRIAVAECAGARWTRAEYGWLFAHPDESATVLWPDGSLNADDLPDYENDPAAWGSALDLERVVVVPLTLGGWCGFPDWESAHRTHSRCGDKIGRAVCLAVLAKHNITEW